MHVLTWLSSAKTENAMQGTNYPHCKKSTTNSYALVCCKCDKWNHAKCIGMSIASLKNYEKELKNNEGRRCKKLHERIYLGRRNANAGKRRKLIQWSQQIWITETINAALSGLSFSFGRTPRQLEEYKILHEELSPRCRKGKIIWKSSMSMGHYRL